MRRALFRTAACVLAFTMLIACASVLAPALAPKVNTDPAALKAGNYELDAKHASLIFKVGHLGFSQYVGRFERFDVSLDFDADNAAAARIEASIDMTSLDIANDDFAETLMGPNWFDASQYPQAIFRSTGIEITGDNTGVMTGDLTLHGVTQPIAMDVVFNGGGNDRLRGAYVIGLSARASIDRRAFGVDRFNGLVSDMVDIEIEAEFKKR